MEKVCNMTRFQTQFRWIGKEDPTYFIADISANHDGDLERAKKLIQLAAKSGADAAKFQNFQAADIVSDEGFNALKDIMTHQSTWRKPVYDVYKDASIPWEWTALLKQECDKAGIDFFSTPYDINAVDMLDPYVRLFKIGSGDITWTDIIKTIGEKGKPVVLSTGASTIGDVQRAMHTLQTYNIPIVLMQCNTNYTISKKNFNFINLNVLKTYGVMFPDSILGISDHTQGHTVILGAVALGARVVEKHFTDDTTREGPDHPFSMTPDSWEEMVGNTRDLEAALGRTDKKIEENEKETIIVQRRALRAHRDLYAGTILTKNDISLLRPAPYNAIMPYDIDKIIGGCLNRDVHCGDLITWTMIDSAR
jgi:sialic acid synthase SpsE